MLRAELNRSAWASRGDVRVRNTCQRLVLLGVIVVAIAGAFWWPLAAAAYPVRIVRASGHAAVHPKAPALYGAASSDGRFVAYQASWADPDGPEGFVSGVYVRDIRAARTRLVSASGDGRVIGQSVSACMSADGRFVAFASSSPGIVAIDTNEFYDVFVRDLMTGEVTCVSGPAGGNARDPSISADGRFVAFVSDAMDLVEGDVGGHDDVFVRDTTTGTVVRVSVSATGTEADAGSFAPGISADGRHVAFTSAASNLVVGDTNRAADIFVRDLRAQTTTRVSVSSSGRQANLGSYAPSISGDGRRVAFESLATNLVPKDTNGARDVFVRDLAARTTVRVSVGRSGAQARGVSREASISRNGRRVAFTSGAQNLVARDTNNRTDVFVRDLTTARTRRVSTRAGGGQIGSHSAGASIAASGVRVVFHSSSGSLSVGDTNGVRDTFVSSYGKRVTDRTGGADSFGVATRASRRAWPQGAGAVVLVNPVSWRDALRASSLAGAAEGPLLYTRSSSIPTEVADEIARLRPAHVYVIGPASTISTEVVAAVQARFGGATVERIGSEGLAAVGSEIASATIALAGSRFDGTVLVASGRSYTDSLAGAALATASRWPVVLADAKTGAVELPAGTRRVVILGRATSVSPGVEARLKRAVGTRRVTRLAGTDSYATAATIARHGVSRAGLSWDGVAFYRATSPAQAVAAGVMAGSAGAVSLPVTKSTLPRAIATTLIAERNRVDFFRIAGTTASVSASVEARIRKALGG